MAVRFPVKADKHDGENDRPPGKSGYAIFDKSGFWANLGGVFFQSKNSGTADNVAKMINAAYYQGRADQRRDFRECIGVGEDDD